MPSWPGSLPDTLPIETTETAEPNVIQTSMDMGVPKVRRRFTSVTKYLEVPPSRFILTNAQKDALMTFFDTTLAGGSLSFNWVATGPTPAYDTDTTTSFRIQGRPEVICIVPGSDSQRLYSSTLKLEVLP